MRKRGWIILLCILLVAGAASDHYGGSWNSGARDRIAVTAPFNPQYTANQNPQSSVEQIATLCGITKFRNSYHTSGAGQKIALIDSGIDLSHEAFQPNADWTDKVVVYRDFTQEGYLYTQAVSCYGDKVAASGTIYHIGQIPNTVQQYRMSFLKLNEFQPELFPETEQQIAVLVTAEQGIYNCVYLDTNQNCDFSDEQPLHCYQEKPQHITLHNSGYNLNLALTSIAENGTQIQLTADTLGHGTFLAGVMAGNGAVYQGLAPQAQLYIYKIFNRDGQSSQVLLAQAIQQAVLDGADSINLSLSIPQEEGICDALEEALNQAQAANVPVVAAAGNYGPGKNTIAYPARVQSVIGVGSYVEPKLYTLDKAVSLKEPFITDYSGRGKLNGACGPLLVAPAGVVSTVPAWYVASYLYDYGTSISAAIVTAAISHVQEAAEKKQLHISTEQMQDLLAAWAKDLDFAASEQGYGALQLKQLPRSETQIVRRSGLQEETVFYEKEENLTWQFSIPQGQTQSWHLQVPAGSRELSAILQISQQAPQNEQEHLVALGRCQISLYDPDGKLVDQTPYLGASYSREIITSGAVKARFPQPGLWEIVITSAENLSQYNHLESTGTLKAEIK